METFCDEISFVNEISFVDDWGCEDEDDDEDLMQATRNAKNQNTRSDGSSSRIVQRFKSTEV